MNKPKVKICTDLPEIGIPNDPIVLYNGSKLLLCYQISPSSAGRYAILQYDDFIEYTVTPINDEGLGKHKYAKYGLKWYSIHEIENIEEINRWSARKLKYWVYCFKDRTFEILGNELNVIASDCDIKTLNTIMNDFIKNTPGLF